MKGKKRGMYVDRRQVWRKGVKESLVDNVEQFLVWSKCI